MTIVTCSPTLNDCSDLVIGESPRWRGLRRNFCRVFSMIPFEAFTISSPAVVDVEHVELEHLTRRAESFREGRPRPAAVPVDPLLDLHDERSPAAEHPCVHVLAAHAVQCVAGAAGFPHELGRDHFLDARRVHFSRPSATVTPFPPAAPARPAGLWHAAAQLAVAATEVEGIHLEIDMVEPGVEDRDDVRAVQGRFFLNEIRYALSDLAVDLGLQRLRARQSELGPERFLPPGHLEIDLRSDPERLELPGLELPCHEGREVVVPTCEAIAHPARSLPIHGNPPDRSAPLLVREAMAESPEETTEAGIA